VINFSYAGSKPRTTTCVGTEGRARNNEVVFNDPCGQIDDLVTCSGTTPPGWTEPCCGEVAVFGTFFNGPLAGGTTQTHDGMQWWQANNFSIIVNNGAQCLGTTDFNEMLTHFMGHAAAFDHHDDVNATMHGQLGVHAPRGATLASTDKMCASAVYHTFKDVPFDRWSWRFVEAFENAGIDTQGCGSGNFCPTDLVNRGKLAVFIIRGVHGPSYVPPPATGTLFADVPASHPDAAYIEQLYNEGLTGGCATNPLSFCPSNNVSRAEMATFLLRISHGSSYTPPPGTGGTFNDVPSTYWASPYIEQLFREGGTAGCSTSPPLYCPEELVQKEQVATFLDRAFNLTLP
jgi:S-layer homology domain